jgi:phage/conjugal plasmid C-4 type zinc finger TraR family protein
MADDIDRAQHHNELHQNLALKAWRDQQQRRPGRSHCIDCEEQIPVRRREANPRAVRCIDCQRAFEGRR